MINPYAHAFMIATRTDPITPPRLRAAREPVKDNRRRGLRRWFGRKS